MKKIKVAHIITKLELGGAQGNTLFTVNALNKEKFDVMLISGAGGILDDDAHQLKAIRTFFVTELVRQLNVFKDIKALFTLTRILSREKPDIVHTHSSKAGILGRWAACFAGTKKIIHTYHGFGFNKYQGFLSRFIFLYAEKLTSAITDVLIFVSNSNMSEAKKAKIGSVEKYMLIRSGINTKFFSNFKADKKKIRAQFNIPEELKIISTISPFKKQKNLEDFIKLASILKSKGVKARFLIVGDGQERPKLEKLTDALNLKEDIVFLSWLKSPVEIAELYTITDVFVLTSLWEGLPRSILEAFSSGVPVCANAVDGVTDVITEAKTGFLSEPHENEKMAENILKILSNPSLREEIVKRASASLDISFDINYMVSQQEELYLKFFDKYGSEACPRRH